jgi:hypothetical protein
MSPMSRLRLHLAHTAVAARVRCHQKGIGVHDLGSDNRQQVTWRMESLRSQKAAPVTTIHLFSAAVAPLMSGIAAPCLECLSYVQLTSHCRARSCRR